MVEKLLQFSLAVGPVSSRRSPLLGMRRTVTARHAGTCACRGTGFAACKRLCCSSKLPYLSSPTIGWPSDCQMHPDLVRAPGFAMVTSSRREARCPGAGARLTSVMARHAHPGGPCGDHLDTSLALAHAGPAAGTCAGATCLAPCASGRPVAQPPGPDRSCAVSRVRGTGPAGAVSALRFLASSRMPLVSRSRRCTSSSEACAVGRARRSCSITPKLTPEPPCTATPAGLSMASSQSSSKQHRKFPGRRRPARTTPHRPRPRLGTPRAGRYGPAAARTRSPAARSG
jgi:hypothetical protein